MAEVSKITRLFYKEANILPPSSLMSQEAKFWIKASPNAPRSEIVGWEENFLKVKIKAVPAKGSANEALVEYLSKVLDIPKSQITLLKGHTSKIKQVKVSGICLEELKKRIEKLLF